METVIPKRVFAFSDTKPDENVYEIRIAMKDALGAIFNTVKVFSMQTIINTMILKSSLDLKNET